MSLRDVRFAGKDFNDTTLELLITKLKRNRTIKRISINNGTAITGYGATILWHHMLQSPIRFSLGLKGCIEEHIEHVLDRAHHRLLVDLCCSTISRSQELVENAKGVVPDELYSICEAFYKLYNRK
eukprot:TRINITY_DN7649_c0_g1_i1.p1 TRINITY_DN7649_c0_g1~~TRINITY_DN7649_c0_g1_i1.p1  ORF type:complete len:126 (-),score=28.93 TRINITY_DN7649_c0_g1_i1:180-557(-)